MAENLYYTFEAGMRVRAKDGNPPDVTGNEWLVRGVKDFRNCCDCYGDDIFGHSPSCICRMWRMEAGHHQRVTIVDSEGKEHHCSGSWFVPITPANPP